MSLNIGIISSSQSAVAPSGTLLLDLYPSASAAYSLRKLRTAYTGNCIRVRRSSDNTETNIGFIAGILDSATLLTFCGIGNGFVTIWYDQSGNSRNATQTTLASQPQIVLNGVLIVLSNSKPATFFNSDFLANTQTFTYGNFSLFMATRYESGLVFVQYSKLDMAVVNSNVQSSDTGLATIASYSASIMGIQILRLHTHLSTLSGATTTSTLYLNGVQRATATRNLLATKSTLSIGATDTGGIPTIQYMQELVLYESSQLSNKTAIESNINSFYTIY